MRVSTAAGLILCLLIVMVTDVSAQLTAAKDGPVVYGHHHLNTTNVEAQKKFFVDTLGGAAIKIGTNNGRTYSNVAIDNVEVSGFNQYGINVVAERNSGGFRNVKITNSGTSAISAWQLVWDFPAGQTLAQAWSSTITVADGKATAKGANYNADVPAGGSVNFGFNANTTGAVPEPASFTLNGSACSTG